MAVIWKFEVPITDEFTVVMPKGAKLLDFQMQGPKGTLWALVNPEFAPNEKRNFRLFGTGNKIDRPENLTYVGTAQDQQWFVWHLFEEG